LMPALVPVEKHGFPVFSTARYDVVVEPDSRPLEVFERMLPFRETLSSRATPFTRAPEGPFKPDSSLRLERDVPLGMVYQARLYAEEGGSTLGDTSTALDKLDMPSVHPEMRAHFLTHCGEARKPQLRLEPGGTYVATTIATGGVESRVLTQLGVVMPDALTEFPLMPFFPPRDIVASEVSEDVDFVHRPAPIDDLSEFADSHVRMSPGQNLFYLIVAWEERGSWDYVWTRAGEAPITVPEPVRTKQRRVEIRVPQLVCLSDSDDLSSGEATFHLKVSDNAGEQIDSYFWEEMDTASTARPGLSIVSSGPRAAGQVGYGVTAVDDDSGSFPPDSDDHADTGLPHTIAFLRGEGRETFNGAHTLEGLPTTSGEEMRFLADVVWDVSYF
jgi:hypothetical protein